MVLSRVQWAKPHPEKVVGGVRIKGRAESVTVYDGDGGFVIRLAKAEHIAFLNQVIIEALRRIAAGDVERMDTNGLMEDDGHAIPQ